MLRAWNFKLELSRVNGPALYLQIAQKIIEEIERGRLPPATVMPGTRELAECLHVNRKTVVFTYEELIAQGWLVTERRRGTFVSKNPPGLLPHSNGSHHVLPHPAIIESKPSAQIRPFDSRSASQGVIDFREGLLDSRLVPYETLARAFRRALVSRSRSKHLEHDDPKGNYELRNSIATMLNMEKGFRVTAENICMVSGSQMGVFVVARIITKANDCVVFENLTYPFACEAFRSCGAKVMKVNVDSNGMRMDELEALCKNHPVRAVFVTPQHQFPTTATMSIERRKILLKLAAKYDFMIIEDDHDFEFQFADDLVFPIASMDKSESVVYIGALSKLLTQGLRVGYLVASEDCIEKFSNDVMLIDRHGASAMELAICELMHSGEIKRHILRMSKIYAERRKLFLELIENELSQWVDMSIPQGGLAFWLRFKQNIKTGELMKNAQLEKVCFSPGYSFTETTEDIQAIRLSYASLTHEELIAGVQRIKLAFAAC